MSNGLYYNKLYVIQDEVLSVIADAAPEFYLTGGTALSRFYLSHRYSDDLDFFVNRDAAFREKTDRFIEVLSSKGHEIAVQISDTDFVRFLVHQQDMELKVELINDVGFHYGDTVQHGNWHIDNWENILTNKITALSRNAVKDYADILFLCRSYRFNWMDVFDAARQKDNWVNEVTVATILDDFDVARLGEVNWIDPVDHKQFLNSFKIIAKDLALGENNSLFEGMSSRG